MESYEILWNTARSEIEKTGTSISYDTFIKPLIPVDIVGDKLVLLVGTKLIADAVKNEPLHSRIREAIEKTSHELTDFTVVIGTSKEEYYKTTQENSVTTEEIETHGLPIKPNFTFDNFVVGASNELAAAAARAVATAPGESYNPLFIYGGTGLGKTHMLMAIANYIKAHTPSVNVLYTTCEQFTNQFIESVAKGRNNSASTDFRKLYRNIDVLLLDDVQFLAKHQGTQTEFFHTFNELVMQNKQVVLTSDRPPKEIEILEERLRSRFEGGLLTDVTIPDLETRVAILRKKSEERKCLIDIKVLTYIAENYESDIRTLEGKLTKVILASKLHDKLITIDLVKEALKESVDEIQEELKADDIINCVCSFYKISKSDIVGKKKNKEFVEPRQICIYLLTEMMTLPQDTIGKVMGGRDHSTVIYSRNKIAEQIKTEEKLATVIKDLKNMILKK